MSNETATDQHLKTLDSYIDNLNDIKEIINDEISDVRYNIINGIQALNTFEKNMLTLLKIKNEVLEIYSSELDSVHYSSISLFKIINLLEKANLLYHEFIEEKLYSGNNKMGVYDQVVDHLVGVFQDLNKVRHTINQITK
jgi:hypothetical protein